MKVTFQVTDMMRLDITDGQETVEQETAATSTTRSRSSSRRQDQVLLRT